MASAIFHARSAFHKSRKGFISLKKALAEASAFFMAEDEGFEPPQTESESGVLPLHKSPMDALRQNASIIIQICAHLSSVNFKKCGKNKHSHFCLPEQKKPARARTARNARRRENEEREKRLFLLSPARSDARRNRPY